MSQDKEQELSYEEIIECIQEDKKVPNMVDVPDIVLPAESISESTLPMRLKPWERCKESGEEPNTESTSQLEEQS